MVMDQGPRGNQLAMLDCWQVLSLWYFPQGITHKTITTVVVDGLVPGHLQQKLLVSCFPLFIKQGIAHKELTIVATAVALNIRQNIAKH